MINPNKISSNNNYILNKIKEEIHDEKLIKFFSYIRHLNMHDFDQALLKNNTLNCKDMDLVYKSIVDKLIKIHVPTLYSKVIQSNYENLIELPLEDKHRFNVLIFDYDKDKNLIIKEITTIDKIETEEQILAMVGRHPFVNIHGWCLCKVAFNNNIKEIATIGQKTWKDRGGDFDGDAMIAILIKLPKQQHEQLEPKVYKSEFKSNEHIELPKIDSKIGVENELKDIRFSKFNLNYTENNKCKIYPSTISHLQNINHLQGAIVTAVQISTQTIHWNSDKVNDLTTYIMKKIKEELPLLKKQDPQLYKNLIEILPKIHRQFFMLIMPLIILEDKIDTELYEACIRIYLKDTGPQIMGRIQKQLLSVSKTPEEIKESLNFVNKQQQQIIDLKKAENPISNYNYVLNIRKNLDNINEIKDIFNKWKHIERNWSKNKKELLFYESSNPDDIDLLVSIIPQIFFKGDDENDD